MARYRASVRTAADRATAFAYLARFDRAAEWDPGVTSGSMLTDEPVRTGSRFRLEARFLGRSVPLEYEVIECLAPGRIVLRAETGMIRSTDTITFTADGSGTIVSYDARLQAKGIGRLAEPVLAVVFRRIGDRAVGGLRAHLDRVASQ